jgi:hypothetical protein
VQTQFNSWFKIQSSSLMPLYNGNQSNTILIHPAVSRFDQAVSILDLRISKNNVAGSIVQGNRVQASGSEEA